MYKQYRKQDYQSQYCNGSQEDEENKVDHGESDKVAKINIWEKEFGRRPMKRERNGVWKSEGVGSHKPIYICNSNNIFNSSAFSLFIVLNRLYTLNSINFFSPKIENLLN